MFVISDAYLQNLIAEDIPYFDLSTHLLNINDKQGLISYYTREECVLCGSEEAARILSLLGAKVTMQKPSGTRLAANETFLEACGNAGALHAAWKVCLNICDHYSAVATKTARIVAAAHAIRPGLPVLTTRKSLPGTKPLMTKAVVVGGASPHRLGLCETVLFFNNHSAFVDGFEGLLKRLPAIRVAACEKKIFVETNADGAFALLEGTRLVDGIQFDKLTPEELCELVPKLRALNPEVTLIAAGGINENNVGDFAKTGVDGLATTALFTAKPLDMSAKIVPN
ncbi:MAG: ModD protein [Coriobacteriales bacterium]|jgi:molybdenum transport protein|nr:ModD protein [Coriobacteriales bacterium]